MRGGPRLEYVSWPSRGSHQHSLDNFVVVHHGVDCWWEPDLLQQSGTSTACARRSEKLSSSAIFLPMYCQPSSVPIARPPVDNVGHAWATGRSVGRPLGRLFHQKVPSESSGGLRRAVRGDHGRRTLTFLPRLEKLNAYGSDHPLHFNHRKLLPEMNREREICGTVCCTNFFS